MAGDKKQKVVITSGYFNPLHIGHINLMREAKKLGDILIVIVNNDEQVKLKGSVSFMPEQERIDIVNSLQYVDETVLSVDSDRSIAKSLEMIAKKHNGKLFFAKGGDRNAGNIPETESAVCKKFSIEIVNGVGGDKVQSSSWLLSRSSKQNSN
jgi:cytidyltransferase-like protein